MDKKNKLLQTIVETPEFIKRAKDCMDDQSKEEFIGFIARNPLSGDLIPGTAVPVNYDGRAIHIKANKEELELFIITMTKQCPFFCLRPMPKIKNQI